MADLQSKKFGDAWVFWPIECMTGASHTQPGRPGDYGGWGVRIDLACELGPAPDFIFFDSRGALDAPETIPSGSVRGQEFLNGGGSLMVGHVYRDGWSL